MNTAPPVLINSLLRAELIAGLVDARLERRRLQAHLIRRRIPPPSGPIPAGFRSHDEFMATRAIDLAIGFGLNDVVDLIGHVADELDRARSSFARRTGTSGRLEPAKWRSWASHASSKHKSGHARSAARELFERGRSYDYALWVVTSAYLASHPPFPAVRTSPADSFTRREADALRKSIDRAWGDVHAGSTPPSPPSGWRQTKITNTGLEPVRELSWASPPR